MPLFSKQLKIVLDDYLNLVITSFGVLSRQFCLVRIPAQI